jgi:hypothetical protein
MWVSNVWPEVPSAHATVTVKTVELVAVPPDVVIAIFPVFAPVGTVAVTCVSLFTVKLADFVPNLTLEV